MDVNRVLENKLMHLCGNTLYAVASMYLGNTRSIQESSIVEAKDAFLGRLEKLIKQPPELVFDEFYTHSPEEQAFLEELLASAQTADWTKLEEFAGILKIFDERYAAYILNLKKEPHYA